MAEATPNDIYLSVTMRMFSTRPNKNGVAVTEAFLDQIASNTDKYLCIPLCADTRKLRDGDHNHLGHMLDKRTGTFLTEQIGAFASFEKVVDEFGTSLIGEARIAKRNKKVCAAIQDLYDTENLNFSFEILAGEAEERDGIIIIDASEHNELIGMSVVSIPAYPEAKALAIVAEIEEDNREREMLARATLEIGEVDFETIRCWFFSALREALGESMWDYRVERLGVDFAILYSMAHGRTLKVEFMAGDEGLILTDAYDVAYTRIEKNGGVNMSEMVTPDLQAQLTAALLEAAELKTQVSARDERIRELEKQAEALTAQTEELCARVSVLEPFQAEAEELRAKIAESENENTRKELRQFAELYRLDPEDAAVAEAILNMDRAALMAESVKAAQEHTPKPIAASRVWTTGIQAEPYGGLLGNE